MKILRVTTLLDFGGVEKRLVNVASTCPNNFEVIFIALGGGGWAANELAQNRKEVICLNTSYRIPNFLLIVKLIKLFLKLKPDVVHTSGAEANFHGQIAAFIARVPKRISEEIGFPNHSKPFRYIFNFVYKLSNKIVCISEAVADKIVELGEARRDKIHVIYNPITYIEHKNPNYPQSGILRFITVCRLTEIKNLTRLLRVFSNLISIYPNARLEIVGDGPERDKLEAFVTEFSLEGKVIFHGFAKDPTPFLQRADVFVLPSYSEGLGNAIMEAMLIGLPCIVSNVGGGKELIEEGVSGWLIDPYDDDQILQKLIIASNTDKQYRVRMGEKGKELLKAKFSSAMHWENLLTIY